MRIDRAYVSEGSGLTPFLHSYYVRQEHREVVAHFQSLSNLGESFVPSYVLCCTNVTQCCNRMNKLTSCLNSATSLLCLSSRRVYSAVLFFGSSISSHLNVGKN